MFKSVKIWLKYGQKGFNFRLFLRPFHIFLKFGYVEHYLLIRFVIKCGFKKNLKPVDKKLGLSKNVFSFCNCFLMNNHHCSLFIKMKKYLLTKCTDMGALLKLSLIVLLKYFFISSDSLYVIVVARNLTLLFDLFVNTILYILHKYIFLIFQALQVMV